MENKKYLSTLLNKFTAVGVVALSDVAKVATTAIEVGENIAVNTLNVGIDTAGQVKDDFDDWNSERKSKNRSIERKSKNGNSKRKSKNGNSEQKSKK